MTATVYLYYTEGGKRLPAVYNINCKRAVAYRMMVEARRAAALHTRIEAAGHSKFTGTNQAGTGIGGKVEAVDVEACGAKYEALANKGSSPEASKEKPKVSGPREIPETEVRRRERVWRSGVSFYPQRETKFKADGDFANNHKLEESLGIPEMEPGPRPSTRRIEGYEGILYCHYCNRQGITTPVDPTTATISKSTKKIACPAHSLSIRDPRFEETAG